MKIIKIDIKKYSREEINLIAYNFNRGKIIIYPTDTIYGIGCSAVNGKAIKKIFKLKGREKNKPLIILVGSFNMAAKFAVINERQKKYLKKVWPGPVTCILKSREKLPKTITAGKDGIAARLPKSDFLVKIIKKFGVPIVSTSANLSGHKEIKKTGALSALKKFTNFSDLLVIDGGLLKGKPSKVVDMRDIDNIKILRK